MQKFIAELIPVSGMNATYIKIPFSVAEIYGTQGRVKIKATIDGAPYRGIIARMEKDAPHILIVTQAIRKAIGKSAGEEVSISLELDTEERVVTIPDDLMKLLLKHKSEKSFFDSLSYTNRKEYVRWIEAAKQSETRNKRLQLIIEKLQVKQKSPSKKT